MILTVYLAKRALIQLQISASSLEQHGNFADITIPPWKVSGNADNNVDLSQTHLDNCIGASEHEDYLGITNPFLPDNHQQSCDIITEGNRQGPSFDDHQPDSMSYTSSTIIGLGLPAGNLENLWLQDIIHLDNIKTTEAFVRMLQESTLDDPSLGMSQEALEWLQNSLCEQSSLSLDEDICLAIDMYLGNPSKATYEVNQKVFLRQLPDAKIPSYYKTGQLVADLTGVESMVHHMCINLCVAYSIQALSLILRPVPYALSLSTINFDSNLGFPGKNSTPFLLGPSFRCSTGNQKVLLMHTICI